jgi:PAS domain S-box-containing protein
MNQATLSPNRRYTDLAPRDNHDRLAVSRIKADAEIGNRSTDHALSKRFTRADSPSIASSEEKQFEPNDLIISRTDVRGTITYCNDIFAKMSGWTKEQLLGSNHNLIRHPEMPQIAYKLVWDSIKAKNEFYGYVKNLCKNGEYYWVFAYITADLDEEGEIVGYTSYRRFAPKLAVETMTTIYKLLLAAEKEGGIEASEKLLYQHLKNSGFSSYDQFIVDLQLKANASMN